MDEESLTLLKSCSMQGNLLNVNINNMSVYDVYMVQILMQESLKDASPDKCVDR